MRKFLKAIRKNLKILFRIKASLIAMILGPLLVIFLISFAFNSSSQFQISLGYSSGDNSTLTTEFVESLAFEYQLKQFDTIDDCVWELKQSLQHVCIEFPPEFVIEEGNTNNISFYVDQTRVNIVYAVLASVNEQIGLKSDQLSEGLTQGLLDTLDSSSQSIDSNLGNLILVKKTIESARVDLEATQTRLNTIDFDAEDIDADFSSELNTLNARARDILAEGQDAVATAKPLVNTIQASTSNASLLITIDQLSTALTDLNTSIEAEYDSYNATYRTVLADIEEVATAVDDLETQLENARASVAIATSDNTEIIEDMNQATEDIDIIKQNLERASQRIGSIEITSSEQIVNPISTNIQTVSSDQNQVLILFPYVLLLIIMFGGLMLSSTLIVLEKKSKAFFRVFTTPTKSQFYIWSSFTTGFIIIIAQLIFVYALMRVFFIDLIGAQLLVNVLLLVIAASLFIMMGMAIGYLMKNQQGANMLSISIGAIFLFLSNIVLPLETVAPYLQDIAKYNPFVLASEILRKSIIFQTPLTEMSFEFMLLGGYTIVIFILITIFHNLAKANFVQRLTKKSKRGAKRKGIKIKNDFITNERELIHQVNTMTDKEFVTLVKTNKKFRHFIREEVSDPIGRRAKKLTKKEFLKAIEDKNREIIAYLEAKKPLHNQKKTSTKKKQKK